MDVDENVEKQEEQPAEQEPAADAAEAPSTGKKQKAKAKPAAAAPAQEAASGGRSKRERKSVEFFVPDVTVREKKSEKPKEVRAVLGVSIRHNP